VIRVIVKRALTRRNFAAAISARASRYKPLKDKDNFMTARGVFDRSARAWVRILPRVF